MSHVIAEFIETLTPKARGHIKGTAKLVIDDHGSVMLDENGATENDGDADVTLSASENVFREILSGDRNPITAVMTGKLKVIGNQMRALKVSSLLVD